MSKKYLVILAIQFIVMAMCLIFSLYQRTLAEAARQNAVELARGHERTLAECDRELRECRGK